MNQRIRIKLIVFFLIVLVIFHFVSRRRSIEMNEIDINKIENFDIILSKGQSVQSKLIGLLKLSTDDYSHIGIIVKANEKIFVLHSTPDGNQLNGIRYDDLQTFINLSSVSDLIVLRYKELSFDFRQKLRMEFGRFKTIQASFDFDFNNFEHKEIYCSELVWLIFKNAGLFETCDFNLGKPIYPKYFLKMNKFIIVNVKKTSL